ncbi:MAG: 50S ribosomal protein L18 [Candidatus Neomarinimicrobiota bacterium]|nr:50S ribosomal protein L18 [Candidatus Neomarinimicrobiota bacterium]RKY48671.1 MAG: 50S ribosomal protein L18 [Candidatus Neomarinimicrobiota bacterium]RKY54549.1 MAG: 50S ribosomal protein L18 [Candidatus Neomarinimicrobiota bacterium]HDN59796.1 50S ribosomal protein L18 [Candidatus Neomarinimicrobiota bacterium]
MDRILKKRLARLRRKKRVRKKVYGTSERPRLVVYRSLKHIYAQIVNDEEHRTLLTVSDLSPEVRSQIKEGMKKVDKSVLVGEVVAKRALEKGIARVVFDRNGYRYHGRVKALADAARKGGLEF